MLYSSRSVPCQCAEVDWWSVEHSVKSRSLVDDHFAGLTAFVGRRDDITYALSTLAVCVVW